MAKRRFLFSVLVLCCFATKACSQINRPGQTAPDLLVGSTPCDSLIRYILRIPGQTKCDFIKWDLSLQRSNTDSTFQLTALYGESQPNTNGFIGGGEKIFATGKYTLQYGASVGPNAKVYCLHDKKLQSSLFLVEMDRNILHFSDSAKNLLVGNGGWGYVLNQIK